MRNRFTPMLEAYDPPTIWESWKGVNAALGARSVPAEALVHSGGAGSAWTLSKHVLGVQPLGAGFEKCRIEPQMDGLLWAKGVFPSVKGNIRVAWERTGERLVLETTLPEGLETVIRLPKSSFQKVAIVHNDRKYLLGIGRYRTMEITNQVVEIRVAGGQHRVEVMGQ